MSRVDPCAKQCVFMLLCVLVGMDFYTYTGSFDSADKVLS